MDKKKVVAINIAICDNGVAMNVVRMGANPAGEQQSLVAKTIDETLELIRHALLENFGQTLSVK